MCCDFHWFTVFGSDVFYIYIYIQQTNTQCLLYFSVLRRD